MAENFVIFLSTNFICWLIYKFTKIDPEDFESQRSDSSTQKSLLESNTNNNLNNATDLQDRQ